jgi:hypothetical protein
MDDQLRLALPRFYGKKAMTGVHILHILPCSVSLAASPGVRRMSGRSVWWSIYHPSLCVHQALVHGFLT